MMSKKAQEQLCILALLGNISEYTGRKLSLKDIMKLSPRDVKKYHEAYQSRAPESANGFMNVAQRFLGGIISRALPMEEELLLTQDPCLSIS